LSLVREVSYTEVDVSIAGGQNERQAELRDAMVTRLV
jgi:hypothetical protein